MLQSTLKGILLPVLFLGLFLAVSSAETAKADEKDGASAVVPTDAVVKLYNGKNFDGLTTWLSDAKHEDPRGVFSIEDGILHISGDGFGYVRTNKKYRDFHLVIEYKWGKRTWGKRKNSARDSGVIVHCIGPDGGCGNIFMAGIEAQIIEGGVGDILAVPAVDSQGNNIPVTISAQTRKDRDGELVWKPGGQKVSVSALARINWLDRDPDWKDEIDFRGKQDADSPFGEWTRMDVICQGSQITIKVNGQTVNKAFDLSTSEGPILVQSEGAEIFVRRWELWPLGKTPQ